MKLFFKILIVVGFSYVLAQAVALCQTNDAAALPFETPSSFGSAPQDIAKVFQDFGIKVSVTNVVSYLFLIYYVAKILRNKTALGQGRCGQILATIVNAEASATPVKKYLPVNPQPAGQPAPLGTPAPLIPASRPAGPQSAASS